MISKQINAFFFVGFHRQTAGKVGYEKIAAALEKHQINALCVIGGFEAYYSVLQMTQERKNYKPFCIPMVVIPCTISNNVPGTDFSLGADTALNEITDVSKKMSVFALIVCLSHCSVLAFHNLGLLSHSVGSAESSQVLRLLVLWILHLHGNHVHALPLV